MYQLEFTKEIEVRLLLLVLQGQYHFLQPIVHRTNPANLNHHEFKLDLIQISYSRMAGEGPFFDIWFIL